MKQSGTAETITPATGIRLSTKIIRLKLKSCGIFMNPRHVVVITVFMIAIINCASITTPNVFTKIFAK